MNVFKTKNPYNVYIYTCFLAQFFFTYIFTVNLLYHVQIVKLNPFELVLAGTILELTVFLFEIPTGIVSDMKSRKLSIIIGYGLIGIAFVVEGLFPLFTAVVISQILWGIGYTFTSGSQQAWISDEIGEDRASSAFLAGAKAGSLGKVIAIPLSMATGYFMINLPIVIGGLCMVGLSVSLIFLMKEDHFKPLHELTRISTLENMKGNIRKIFAYSKASQLMRLLFLIALFVGFYSEGFDRLWISHFFEASNLAHLTDQNMVILLGGVQFIVVLLSFTVLHYLNRSSIHGELKRIYTALLIGSGLIVFSLLGFAFSTSIISLLAFYILIQVARQSMYPLENIWLNKLIPDSTTRATFFSVKGQVDAIGQISGGPVVGVIATGFSIKTAILASALFLSPVLILYKRVLKKSRG
ncbi:MFS transporter [Bacillus sp. S/N-304-OC-R1]|uniref:MFS transporter n=1 Tax=Bacillus sp. S/N-304-OC-R1 TaxID=2758034 RepID=UPI001C8E3D6F|nr:MFS transporter [Bacillus sp. S/N-304-OC-R1]MBY0123055.1 MFS transporter [Bacillus sp. S/N-304-OC-R1]